MLKVRLFDDEEGQLSTWATALQALLSGSAEVKAITSADFGEAVADLEGRRATARKSASRCGEPDNADNIFDDTDVFIVDYDLLELFRSDGTQSRSETGERVAYLVRCFSKCRYIVALHQFHQTRTFDLTLRGHLDSFADLNLSGEDILEPSLWFGSAGRYRPWAWPRVIGEPSRLTNCADDIYDHLGEPILSVVGLRGDEPAPLPATGQLAQLAGVTVQPEHLTFPQFIEESPLGLQPKDKAPSDSAVARIAAARLSKWIERSILPGQNLVIDAPHLAYHYPSLNSDGDVSDDLARLDRPGADLPLRQELLTETVPQHPHWFSRPVWNVSEVKTQHAIAEVANAWQRVEPGHVFCEDTSKYVEKDRARQYEADVPSYFRLRWIEMLEGVQYVPAVWLL